MEAESIILLIFEVIEKINRVILVDGSESEGYIRLLRQNIAVFRFIANILTGIYIAWDSGASHFFREMLVKTN